MSLVHRLKETDKKIMLAVLLAVTWYKKKSRVWQHFLALIWSKDSGWIWIQHPCWWRSAMSHSYFWTVPCGSSSLTHLRVLSLVWHRVVCNYVFLFPIWGVFDTCILSQWHFHELQLSDTTLTSSHCGSAELTMGNMWEIIPWTFSKSQVQGIVFWVKEHIVKVLLSKLWYWCWF